MLGKAATSFWKIPVENKQRGRSRVRIIIVYELECYNAMSKNIETRVSESTFGKFKCKNNKGFRLFVGPQQAIGEVVEASLCAPCGPL